MKYEKSCGSIVIDNDKVLLIKHKLGHWDLPKGHVEDGESEIDTAIREVKEETNVDIEIDSNYRYEISYSPYEGIIKKVIYFLGKPISSELKNQESEVSLVKYVSFDEAMSLITYDNTREILKKLLVDLHIL